MQNPPLQPLHLNSVLSQAKLNHYARLTTEELIRSLEPGKIGALKTRPDGTVTTATTGSRFFGNAASMSINYLAKY